MSGCGTKGTATRWSYASTIGDPFVRERIIDLSFAAAKQLGITDAGTAPVHIEALGYCSADGDGPGPYRPPKSYDAGDYAIQIAAFTSRENAGRLASRMRKSYGSAAIQDATVKGNRFFRVRVGSYGSLAKAEKARGEFERSGYPGSFVVGVELGGITFSNSLSHPDILY